MGSPIRISNRRTFWVGAAALAAVLAGSPGIGAASPELRKDVAPLPVGEGAKDGKGPVATSTMVSYDNLAGDETAYYAGQGGHEALDDLHAVQSGDVAVVSFRYFDPGTPVGPGAYVTVYANPGGLDAGAQIVGGPVYVGGLVAGTVGTAQASFPGTEPVGQDLWIGIRFTSGTAGLVISEVPTVGTSHDYYREDGSLFYFGGNPVANFSIRVEIGAPVGIGEDPAGPVPLLGKPSPNPMRSNTELLLSLEQAQTIQLAVFDIHGGRVATLADGMFPAGTRSIRWNGRDRAGRDAAGGIYFFRLRTSSGAVLTRRVVLVR